MLSLPATRRNRRHYRKAVDLFSEEPIEECDTSLPERRAFKTLSRCQLNSSQARGALSTSSASTSKISSSNALHSLRLASRNSFNVQDSSEIKRRSRRLLQRADAGMPFRQFNKIMSVELSFLRGSALVHRDRRLLYICDVKDQNGARVSLQLFNDVLCIGKEVCGAKRNHLDDQELLQLYELGIETARNCLRIVHKTRYLDYYFCDCASLRTFLDALISAKSQFDSIGRYKYTRPSTSRSKTDKYATMRKLLPSFSRSRATPSIDGPVWQPDQSADICTFCETTRFTVFNRRHHCRLCGKVICGDCSRFRDSVYGDPAPMRVCLTHVDTTPRDRDRNTIRLLYDSVSSRRSYNSIDRPTVRRIR